MKLKDLIDALAAEIENIQPQLGINLDDLLSLTSDDPAFMDALDQYSGQVQRMGEAMELAGFPGLQEVCNHVLENTLLLASQEPDERQSTISFLRRWPALMVYYLQHLEDPSAAAGLLDHMRSAPHPMGEETILKVMHQLGAMPLQISLPGEGEHNQRPIVASPDEVALEVPEDVDQKLMEGFLQEAPEQARHLVEIVERMAAGEASMEDITAAKRVAHTLKGSGAIIGLRGLTALGHNFEDVLEHFETQGGHVAAPVADVLIDGAYCLEQMVAFVAGTDEYPDQSLAVLQSVLDLANRIDRGESLDQPVHRVMQGEPVPAPVHAEPSKAASAPSDTSDMAAPRPAPSRKHVSAAAPAAALRVNLDRIEELFRVSAEISVHTAAMEARVKQLTGRARELLEQNLRVQKRLFELETVVDVRALTMMRARSSREASEAFDPLEMDQYNELHSTAHALMEESNDARILSLRIEEDIAQLAGMQTRQQLLSRDLQHLVVGTRMTEVGVLEPRLQRNIRTTSQVTGKLAVLSFEGGHTLIDSDVLNKLAEPLLHLLRNAVDHGLELPHERRKLGKSEVGNVALEFSRQGQQVVLRCTDDGRGLDLDAIRHRAIERGLIRPDQVLSDEDVTRLVLMSGFTTRDSVSEVSGRGVGMDVVRTWVEGMNGTIRVNSKPGQGCQVELRFAASLSTMQSLVVQAGQQRFALPSVQVEQAVPRGVGSFVLSIDRLQYHHSNRVLRAVYLSELTGLPRDAEKPLQDYDVVIVRVQDRLFALAVDALVDSRELLVKHPGRYARHVRGVAGLSILGDGSIAVHLDLVQMLSAWQEAGKPSTIRPAVAVRKEDKPQLPSVLVVDDALSVRNTLQQLVEDAGFRVETARDGLDALNTMRTFKPHVVLTDLEMPNMNGVELTMSLRNQEATKTLPIIMITSRSQEKHKELAERAGVDAYITKPYNEGELLKVIRKAITA